MLARLLLLALLALGGPAMAQNAIGTARNTVTIGVGEGRLFRLDRDATNVFVANSAVADVQIASPRMVYVYGRRLGLTTLTAVGAQDNVAGALQIRVERNADAAQGAMAARAPAVQLSFAGDRLVLRGPVADIGQAMEVESTAQAYSPSNLPPLDRTRLAGAQQVTLRVRIAEVARNDLNRLGVNLSVLANPGSFTVSFLTNSFINGIAGGENSLLGALGIRTNRVAADALINALQREGVLTLLAEPNLTTLSGETANFLAGGEVPIPTPQAFNVTTITYKPFGVALAFTPTLLPGNRIAMRVRPEVSEISSANSVSINGYNVPSFTTRKVETNVEMASGQTMAIAGLFQRRIQDDLDRVPFLGDVPILGALFRSQRFQRSETELMVLITPYLTGPVIGADALPLPTEGANRRGRPVSRAGFVVN